MKRISRLVPLLAIGLALLPATALASTTYHESVFGVETGFPQSTTACPYPNSVSSFAGAASGTLDGVFQIAVCHESLGTSAKILRGTFTVVGDDAIVHGAFAGGRVTRVSGSTTGSFCTQTFTVSGTLLPAGSFSGKLKHYGYGTATSCNVFFATISGSATLIV